MSTSRIWSVVGLLLGTGGVLLDPLVLGGLPNNVARIVTLIGFLFTAFNERVQGSPHTKRVEITLDDSPPLPQAKTENERDTKPLGE